MADFCVQGSIPRQSVHHASFSHCGIVAKDQTRNKQCLVVRVGNGLIKWARNKPMLADTERANYFDMLDNSRADTMITYIYIYSVE